MSRGEDNLACIPHNHIQEPQEGLLQNSPHQPLRIWLIMLSTSQSGGDKTLTVVTSNRMTGGATRTLVVATTPHMPVIVTLESCKTPMIFLCFDFPEVLVVGLVIHAHRLILVVLSIHFGVIVLCPLRLVLSPQLLFIGLIYLKVCIHELSGKVLRCSQSFHDYIYTL